MQHKQCKRPPCVLIIAALFLSILAESVRKSQPKLAKKLIAAANRTSAAKAAGGGNCILHNQQQTACTQEQRKEAGCSAGGKGRAGKHSNTRPLRKASAEKWKYRCRVCRKIQMSALDPAGGSRRPRHTASECSSQSRGYCDLAPASCTHAEKEVCDC